MSNKIKILFVEDKVIELLDKIKGHLGKTFDVDIKHYDNGEDVINNIKADKPCLILLDLKIPWSKMDTPYRENGEKLLRKLCNVNSNYIVPTVIITAYPDILEEPVRFGRDYRIYGYLSKGVPDLLTRLENIVSEIINGTNKQRERFCSIASKICNRGVSFKGPNSCFLAYSSEGRYAGFMKDLKNGINSKPPLVAFDWLDTGREFDSPSSLIFCPFLCDRVFSRNIILANITDKNPNVYFEWGFALAIGRKTYALCESSAINNLPTLFKGNLITPYNDVTTVSEKIYFIDYLGGNLYGNLLNIFPSLYMQYENTKENLIIASSDVRHQQYIVGKIKDFSHPATIDMSPINAQTTSIIEVLNKVISYKRIIFDLLSDSDSEHENSNAHLMFLAGFALGYGKRIILLQEKPVKKNILDVYPILLSYGEINEVKEKIAKFIK